MDLIKYEHLNEYVKKLEKIFEEHGVKIETIFDAEKIDEELMDFGRKDMQGRVWILINEILDGSFIFCKLSEPIKINQMETDAGTKKIPVYHFFVSLDCPESFSEKTLFEGINKKHIMTWSTGYSEQVFAKELEWLKDVELPIYSADVRHEIENFFDSEKERLYKAKPKIEEGSAICTETLIEDYKKTIKTKNRLAKEIKKQLPEETFQNFNFKDFDIKENQNIYYGFSYGEGYRQYENMASLITLIDKNDNELSFVYSKNADEEELKLINDYKNEVLKNDIEILAEANLTDIIKQITESKNYDNVFNEEYEEDEHNASKWNGMLTEENIISELKKIGILNNNFNFNEFKIFSVISRDYEVDDIRHNGEYTEQLIEDYLLVDGDNNRICFGIKYDYHTWTDFHFEVEGYMDNDYYRSYNYSIQKPSNEMIADILNEKADKIINKEEEIVETRSASISHGDNR